MRPFIVPDFFVQYPLENEQWHHILTMHQRKHRTKFNRISNKSSGRMRKFYLILAMRFFSHSYSSSSFFFVNLANLDYSAQSNENKVKWN